MGNDGESGEGTARLHNGQAGGIRVTLSQSMVTPPTARAPASMFESSLVFFRNVGAAAVRVAERCDPYVPRLLKSKWTLAAVCALAVALRMAEAIVFPGFEFPDEIYQVLEQAHRLAFGNGFIPWEFDEGVRSYMLPGVLAGIFRAAESAWPGSYLLAARLALSLLSLVPVCCSWAILRRFAGPRAAPIRSEEHTSELQSRP